MNKTKLTKADLESRDGAAVITWLITKPSYKPMDFYQARMKAFLPDESLLKMHKRVFGKQNLCWQGATHRQWIWEFDTDLLIFVSNHQGVAYEMPRTSTLAEVESAMASYLERLLGWSKG